MNNICLQWLSENLLNEYPSYPMGSNWYFYCSLKRNVSCVCDQDSRLCVQTNAKLWKWKRRSKKHFFELSVLAIWLIFSTFQEKSVKNFLNKNLSTNCSTQYLPMVTLHKGQRKSARCSKEWGKITLRLMICSKKILLFGNFVRL